MYFFKRFSVLLLLLCLGCSAQSSSQDATNLRLKRLIRGHFQVPPRVEIQLCDRKPSEFTGYDDLPVTLTEGVHSHTYHFYVSKDGAKLIQMQEISDPQDKMNLAGRPSRGPKDAKVVIVNYDDFQCPYCAANHKQLFSSIMKDYGDKVRVIYKDYPLFEIHPWAGRAAVDSGCLAAQNNDAYWEFADYIHQNQKEITGKDRPVAEQFAALDKLVSDVGQKHKLDMQQLQACVKAQDETQLRASVKEGNSLGVEATPTMFVNGQKVDGAVPEAEFRAMLDRALRDAGDTPPASAQAARPSLPLPTSGQVEPAPKNH